MNLNELHAKLIAIAKSNPPSDSVPYAFEKRLMSRLASAAPPNPWAIWAGPLWRAALSCVAITVLCGFWAMRSAPPADATESLSQSFEAAVFVPATPSTEDAW